MKAKDTLKLNRGALALLALLPLASPAAETVDAGQDQADEPQTHVLFTGADIRILYDGKPYPVEDVDGTSLAIRIKEGPKGLNIARDLKRKRIVVARVQTLANRSVTVANFKHDRVYTPERDPLRKASDAVLTAHAMGAQAEEAMVRALRAPAQVAVAAPGGKQMIDNPDLPKLQAQQRMLEGASNSRFGDAGYLSGKAAEELGKEDFDALEVKFELSSQSPIENAYVVVLANYHTQDDPKTSQTWLAARSVGLIDSKPHKMSLFQGGLPPGFVLEKVHLHLYERGVEIATDLSENRASLTRDEAHEYLVIDHLSSHKDDTVPGRIALTKVPEDWASHPRDESFRKTYYVKVDTTGHPVGVFEDEACKTGVADSYCEAVLREQLFLPALAKGNPVDSVVPVKLGKLSI